VIEVSEVVLSGLSLGPMGRFQSEAGKEGQSSPSPGQRPGLSTARRMAPCKGSTIILGVFHVFLKISFVVASLLKIIQKSISKSFNAIYHITQITQINEQLMDN